MSQLEIFQEFLREDVGLGEEDINRLLDAGFDDIESLQLAKLDTFLILGFQNSEKVFDKISRALQ